MATTLDRELTEAPQGPWHRLFAEIAEGRSAALAELYDLAADRLYGLALWRTGCAEDAGDVVQDVFVKLAKQGRKLLRVNKPETWLMTITRRQAVDLVRRRGRRAADYLDDHPFLLSPDSNLDRSVDADRATIALGELPVVQREVVYLHLFCDMTFRQIGTITRVPTFTAASRYRLAISKLRRHLEVQP